MLKYSEKNKEIENHLKEHKIEKVVIVGLTTPHLEYLYFGSIWVVISSTLQGSYKWIKNKSHQTPNK